MGGGQTRARKLRLAKGLTTCWGRPPPAPPTAPKDFPPQPGPPTGASHHTMLHRPLRSAQAPALSDGPRASTSKGVLFQGEHSNSRSSAGPIFANAQQEDFLTPLAQLRIPFISLPAGHSWSSHKHHVPIRLTAIQTRRLPPGFSVSPVEVYSSGSLNSIHPSHCIF